MQKMAKGREEHDDGLWLLWLLCYFLLLLALGQFLMSVSSSAIS